jgi:hypothetical protein
MIQGKTYAIINSNDQQFKKILEELQGRFSHQNVVTTQEDCEGNETQYLIISTSIFSLAIIIVILTHLLHIIEEITCMFK